MLHFDHLFLHEAVHVRHHLVSSPAKRLITLFKDIQILHLVLDFKDAGVEFLFERVAEVVVVGQILDPCDLHRRHLVVQLSEARVGIFGLEQRKLSLL